MDLNKARNISNVLGPVAVAGASASSISLKAGITVAAAHHGLVVSVLLGYITGTLAVELQQSTSGSIFTDLVEDSSLSSSTNKTATANISVSTKNLTVTAHGYAEDSMVAIRGTTLPVGLSDQRIYYVHVVDANTIQLKLSPGLGAVQEFSSNGSSCTTTPVSEVKIKVSSLDSGQAADFPLENTLRVRLASSSGGGTAQVLAVMATGVV